MIKYLLIIFLIDFGVHTLYNGSSLESNEFKYVVFVKISHDRWCSGIVMSPVHILTAAHCVEGENIASISVIGGKTEIHNSIDFSSQISVEAIYIHHKYKPILIHTVSIRWENDIAVLKLVRQFDGLQNVVTIGNLELNSNSDSDCRIIGWQSVGHNEIEFDSKKLVYLDVKIQNDRYHLLNEKSIQTLSEFSHFEREDCGIPLICKNFLVGMIVNVENSFERSANVISMLPYVEFLTTIINNGINDVYEEEFPYVISILHNNNHICGGFIVNDNHIVTAGHCVKNMKPPDLKIAVGLIKLTFETKIIKVSQIYDHPCYDKISYHRFPNKLFVKNDIAILELEENIEWSPTINKGTLAEPFTVNDNLCHIIRWYRVILDNGFSSIILKKSPAFLFRKETCEKSGNHLELNQLCAQSPYLMTIASIDDIGNPIVCNGKIIGIVINISSSLVIGPTTILNINEYQTFIDAVLYF